MITSSSRGELATDSVQRPLRCGYPSAGPPLHLRSREMTAGAVDVRVEPDALLDAPTKELVDRLTDNLSSNVPEALFERAHCNGSRHFAVFSLLHADAAKVLDFIDAAALDRFEELPHQANHALVVTAV